MAGLLLSLRSVILTFNEKLLSITFELPNQSVREALFICVVSAKSQ